jgi:FkbM family methyltransferase
VFTRTQEILDREYNARAFKLSAIKHTSPSKMGKRCVVSLTSTPDRVFKIRPVLESLLAQTVQPDAIILTLPQVFRRNGQPYVVPSWLSDPSDAQFLPGVTVYRISRDYGPATKVMGALECEHDPQTRIIYVDDDAVYHPDMVADLCRRSEAMPGSALGYSGIGFFASSPDAAQLIPLFMLERAFARKMVTDCVLSVPALEGHWGVLVKRGFFDLDAFRAILSPDDVARALYMNDDVSINAHLASRSIPRQFVCVAANSSVCRATVATDQSDYDRLSDALHQQAYTGDVVGGANNANYSKCLMTHAKEPRYAEFLKNLVLDINHSTHTFRAMFQEALTPTPELTTPLPPPSWYLDLRSLQVYDPAPFQKQRVGSAHDGGYVIVHGDAMSYDLVLSAGIETNIDFETAFLTLHPRVQCEAFDGTVQSFPPTTQNIRFHKMNIGPTNSASTTNWHSYLDTSTNVFVKMDIEGSEYEWIDTLTDTHLSHILQLVIEFHSPYKQEQHWKMIDKLNTTHYLVHIHGNNFAPIVHFTPNPLNATLPDVFECTFVRKTAFSAPPAYNVIPFPLPQLDTPNCKVRPDIPLAGYPYARVKNAITEEKVSSQNGEDGVLKSIFNAIGHGTKKYLEFGAHAHENNTAFLRQTFGWSGVMWDGVYESPSIGLHKEFITKENIHDLCDKYGIGPSLDLLSIDVDYNDYHLWEEIAKKITPRVVVIETNAQFGPNVSQTVPYDATAVWDGTNHFGATPRALQTLGHQLGYALVYADSSGTNLFFVHRSCNPQFPNQDNLDALFQAPQYGRYPSPPYPPKWIKGLSAKTFVTEFGMLTLPITDMYITPTFEAGNYWEVDTIRALKSHVPAHRNMLEIGGHCGTSTLAYASYVQGKQYVFEPQPDMFSLLKSNVRVNELADKIQCIPEAVFCFTGKICMHAFDLDGNKGRLVKELKDKDEPCNYGGVGIGSGGDQVTCLKLDDCMDKFDNIGFIHCDAQGSEPFIFWGAQKFLATHRPVILFEDMTLYGTYLYDNIKNTYPEHAEAAAFNVIKFCMEELKYTSCHVAYNGGMDTLLIP